jgi:ABC-2 type transport system permease protein
VARSLASYGLLITWQVLRLRELLITLTIVNLALAVGIIYGLALLIPNIDPRSAMFLATGAPTTTLLISGLQTVPQQVAEERMTGRAEFMSSLPIAPLVRFSSEVTYWFAAFLPGTALALLIGALRFDFALQVGWAALLVFPLIAFTGAAAGYALALVIRPQITQHVTQFLTLALFLFSPINFPISRLPEIVQAIHRVFPFAYMADLVRWSLTGRHTESVGVALLVVGAWCAAAVITVFLVARRRD